MEKDKTIAVIGAGISGITAAWLLSRRHNVTLIEKEPQLGGHAHTCFINSGPDTGTPIDMGFIVLNDRTYPTLLALFDQWQVNIQNSDMSFGFEDKASGFFYSSDFPKGMFARKRNLLSITFWNIIRDLLRFNKIAFKELKHGIDGITLGCFLKKYKFSKAFINYHIVPVSSAVWSTPFESILDFPAESILRFYDNHGLLDLGNRPQWYTVAGGSISYIRAFENLFQGKIIKSSAVRSIERTSEKVKISCNVNANLEFDYVVLAVHADTVNNILINPTEQEKTIFSKWSYNKNQVTLHKDEGIMPPKKKAWACWNYHMNSSDNRDSIINMSYYMNRLQSLDAVYQYFVTLNGELFIDPGQMLKSILFEHPCYTYDSLSTQNTLKEINGKNRLYYCGAYCGYGFHEDGARSGLNVAEKFGIQL